MKTKETAVLAAKGLGKNSGKVPALQNLNYLEVNPGEAVALLGANGARKTTMMKLLLGLIKPNAGEVQAFGLPASKIQIRGCIG
jgi:ABC-type multidrug transport system ATPase subunit